MDEVLVLQVLRGAQPFRSHCDSTEKTREWWNPEIPQMNQNCVWRGSHVRGQKKSPWLKPTAGNRVASVVGVNSDIAALKVEVSQLKEMVTLLSEDQWTTWEDNISYSSLVVSRLSELLQLWRCRQLQTWMSKFTEGGRALAAATEKLQRVGQVPAYLSKLLIMLWWKKEWQAWDF